MINNINYIKILNEIIYNTYVMFNHNYHNLININFLINKNHNKIFINNEINKEYEKIITEKENNFQKNKIIKKIKSFYIL